MASKVEPGSEPVAKQALAQKRNVRDLNTRLEMYVRAQNDKQRQINQLKEHIARIELENRKKLEQQKLIYDDQAEQFRKSIENLEYDTKVTHQELDQANINKKEFEDRLIGSESRNAHLSSQVANLTTDLKRSQQELDDLRKVYHSMKYKYDTYELEKNSFDEKIQKYKQKNEQLLRELTQKETQFKTEKDTFQRVLVDKNQEIENLRTKIKNLEMASNTTQTRLRKEFDQKLAEFVQKREEQYKQEKDEWMRIFKEEFNRKLRSFKEANQELSHVNVKQSEENTDLRTRISKLKQQKTEIEVTCRELEEETEKLRTDLDDIRRLKDAEIKSKNQIIMQQRDEYKAKELQFDELAGIKLQLDSEIELYRNILNEAEQASGYVSPLNPNTNTGHRQSRKRRRMEINTMTPMGPFNAGIKTFISGKDNNNKNKTDKDGKVETPGIGRAAKNAQNDLRQALNSDVEDEEMKDAEEDSFDVDTDYVTPGGDIEGGSLIFSGLDLLQGMIEIQNVNGSDDGRKGIDLSGYWLSNKSGHERFELPKGMKLEYNDKLRIFCGSEMNEVFNTDLKIKRRNEILGEYEGKYVFWGKDVWSGKEEDCARLYDPNHSEIARIEIHPDMVSNAKGNGCFIM